jgi:hypothetical protein
MKNSKDHKSFLEQVSSTGVDQFRSPAKEERGVRGSAWKSQKGRPHFDLMPGETFLRPIPYEWIRKASRLPGRALAAGLGLWKQMAFQRVPRGKPFIGSSSLISREFGIPRSSLDRGIESLVSHALLGKIRRSGKKCVFCFPVPEAVIENSNQLKDAQDAASPLADKSVFENLAGQIEESQGKVVGHIGKEGVSGAP